VSSAVKFAKKVKGLWKPLTFTVTDLQFISDVSGDEEPENLWGFGKDDVLTKSAVKDPTREETFELTDQFGCDAAVMLIGEEIEQDQGANEIMLEFLVREGTPGAGDTTQRGVEEPRPSRSKDSQKGTVDMDAVDDLLAWLDDDEDSDEGTIVVIGRTHFFSGEMRCYDG